MNEISFLPMALQGKNDYYFSYFENISLIDQFQRYLTGFKKNSQKKSCPINWFNFLIHKIV